MAKKNYEKKRGSGGFFALPHRVLKSSKFGNLSANATKLLMDLAEQYQGNNNGDLCAALTLMKARGWKSNSGLTAARKELVSTRFIVSTRMGGRNRPELFALSFFAIDECWDRKGQFRKHDADATTRPNDDWLHGEPVPDLKAAQVRKRKADTMDNIIQLEKHIESNPDDKYLDGYKKGVKALEKQIQN